MEGMEEAWLWEAIGFLPQKARRVLVRRYGLDDRNPPAFAELAAELKLSRERVRQLQCEAEFLLKSGTRRVPAAPWREDPRSGRFGMKALTPGWRKWRTVLLGAYLSLARIA